MKVQAMRMVRGLHAAGMVALGFGGAFVLFGSMLLPDQWARLAGHDPKFGILMLYRLFIAWLLLAILGFGLSLAGFLDRRATNVVIGAGLLGLVAGTILQVVALPASILLIGVLVGTGALEFVGALRGKP